MLIGLAIFNVSLLLSPVLFLEERMELKFWFLNHSGSTGVFITTIRIKSFPRKITAHTLTLLKLRLKQGTHLPSSTAICRHFLIFSPLVLNRKVRGNPPPLQKQPTAQHRHKNKEKQQQSGTGLWQLCKEGDEGIKAAGLSSCDMWHNVTGHPEIPSSAKWHKESSAASPMAILIPQVMGKLSAADELELCLLWMKTSPPQQSPISWQTASLPASSMLLRRRLPQAGLQKGRETMLIPGTNLALASGHAALQILLLCLKWKDWIAYVFLILLPPVAGPEIVPNPHICHAHRISFSWSGSALCVTAQRPRSSPGQSTCGSYLAAAISARIP